MFDFGAPSRVPWKRQGLPPPPSSEAPPIRVCLASTSPNSSLTLLQTAAPTVAVTETDTDPATLGVRQPDSRCVRLLPTSSLHQTGATAAPTSTRIESPPASHTRSSTIRASCQSTSRPGRPPRAQRYTLGPPRDPPPASHFRNAPCRSRCHILFPSPLPAWLLLPPAAPLRRCPRVSAAPLPNHKLPLRLAPAVSLPTTCFLTPAHPEARVSPGLAVELWLWLFPAFPRELEVQ